MGFHTSDQHKEVSHARKERDKKDITSILSFLTDRNPFLDDPSLRNIDTGTTADSRVNADRTKEIGTNIIQSMSGQNILNFTFKRSQQVITLSTKTSIKIDGEPIQVDPQLLFQRLTTTANTLFDIWLRTILVLRRETRCRHIGYSYRLTAMVRLYAPSHRQDNTYHGLCYTSRGAVAGTRNSSMGPPHEGSIRYRSKLLLYVYKLCVIMTL